MQVLEVIRTIEWLDSVAQPFISIVVNAVNNPQTRSEGDPLLLAVYEHSRIRAIFNGDPSAAAVLEAFGLGDSFLQQDRILKLATKKRPEDKPTEILLHELYARFVSPWRVMAACAEPLKHSCSPCHWPA